MTVSTVRDRNSIDDRAVRIIVLLDEQQRLRDELDETEADLDDAIGTCGDEVQNRIAELLLARG